ncbi:MAG: 23S rRNA (guanosine(2251)-2'-O)-methyltransferase RlmB [Deltaproteobacteria bacterium]|nr:23S rRNA (guanosine(2251)-2'-O)-methyltransferase RlmB [Deltaproteobacteria bacterium]
MKPPEAEKIIYGVHPVLEALRQQGDCLEEVMMARGGRGRWFEEVKRLAQRYGVRFRLVEPAWLARVAGPVHHQGILARTCGYRYLPEADLLARLSEAGDAALTVAADCLQDPMNLGNLLRTAAAVGVQGVLIPKDRAVGVTSTVAKAAAGALAHIPVCRVTNLTDALARLKEIGLWVIGAEAEAPQTIYGADLRGPLALVIGSEGRGLRPRVRQACDRVLAIPMAAGKIGSLNAATAGAVLLYEVFRQRLAATS